MPESRTQNSIKNILSSVGVKLNTLILSFASRTVFIYVLGAEYLGLNGLFTNILSFLALSDLGLGIAIAYLLYSPLATNNVERIKIIMKFYKKCYLIIGGVILLLGCAIMPFLKYLVNLEQPIPENLYLVFFLFVLNSAISYFFVAYKQTLIEADQKKYLTTKIEIVFTLLNCTADIIVLLIFRNYIVYLVARCLLVVVRNLVLSRFIDKRYPFLLEPVEQSLSKDEVKQLFKDIASVSVFRLGSVLFNSVTNIVISAVVGTIVVGYYSNYTMLVTQIETFYVITVGAIGASIGNAVAVETKERQYDIYKRLDKILTAVLIVCSVCLIQLLNSFVNLWLGNIGKEYVLSQSVVVLIVANLYTNCSCQLLDRFRTANGLFTIGRDLQVIGGCVNIWLSVLLAKTWGFEGVLIAPFLCKIFITVTPFVTKVGHAVFDKSYGAMLCEYFSKILLIAAFSIVIWFICRSFHLGTIRDFVIESFITVSIIVVGMSLLYYRTLTFKKIINQIH